MGKSRRETGTWPCLNVCKTGKALLRTTGAHDSAMLITGASLFTNPSMQPSSFLSRFCETMTTCVQCQPLLVGLDGRCWTFNWLPNQTQYPYNDVHTYIGHVSIADNPSVAIYESLFEIPGTTSRDLCETVTREWAQTWFIMLVFCETMTMFVHVDHFYLVEMAGVKHCTELLTRQYYSYICIHIYLNIFINISQSSTPQRPSGRACTWQAAHAKPPQAPAVARWS